MGDKIRIFPSCEAERTQLLTAIKRIKTFLPLVTDAEQAEATRQDLRKLEQSYESMYRNQYKCPSGNKNCGENAEYCGPCNEDWERYLLLINDDR